MYLQCMHLHLYLLRLLPVKEGKDIVGAASNVHRYERYPKSHASYSGHTCKQCSFGFIVELHI